MWSSIDIFLKLILQAYCHILLFPKYYAVRVAECMLYTWLYVRSSCIKDHCYFLIYVFNTLGYILRIS